MRGELNDIIIRLNQGDKNAFNALFYIYADKISRFSRSYFFSSEEAEEVVQEVFLKIWLNRKSIDAEANFDAYIFTIAKNLIFNLLKKKLHSKKYQEYSKRNSSSDNSTQEKVIFNETEAMVKKALDQLPKKRKLVFLLSRKVGLKNHEIAKRLNISVKTVETHMTLSLKHLRHVLTLSK